MTIYDIHCEMPSCEGVFPVSDTLNRCRCWACDQPVEFEELHCIPCSYPTDESGSGMAMSGNPMNLAKYSHSHRWSCPSCLSIAMQSYYQEALRR